MLPSPARQRSAEWRLVDRFFCSTSTQTQVTVKHALNMQKFAEMNGASMHSTIKQSLAIWAKTYVGDDAIATSLVEDLSRNDHADSMLKFLADLHGYKAEVDSRVLGLIGKSHADIACMDPKLIADACSVLKILINKDNVTQTRWKSLDESARRDLVLRISDGFKTYVTDVGSKQVRDLHKSIYGTFKGSSSTKAGTIVEARVASVIISELQGMCLRVCVVFNPFSALQLSAR